MMNEDVRQFQVKLPAELMDEFDAVIAMTGMTKASVVQQAIENYVSIYENNEGKFRPIPGQLLRNPVSNTDGTVEQVESKCMILRRGTLQGKPYTTIYERGHVYKVPSDCVVARSDMK